MGVSKRKIEDLFSSLFYPNGRYSYGEGRGYRRQKSPVGNATHIKKIIRTYPTRHINYPLSPHVGTLVGFSVVHQVGVEDIQTFYATKGLHPTNMANAVRGLTGALQAARKLSEEKYSLISVAGCQWESLKEVYKRNIVKSGYTFLGKMQNRHPSHILAGDDPKNVIHVYLGRNATTKDSSLLKEARKLYKWGTSGWSNRPASPGQFANVPSNCGMQFGLNVMPRGNLLQLIEFENKEITEKNVKALQKDGFWKYVPKGEKRLQFWINTKKPSALGGE